MASLSVPAIEANVSYPLASFCQITQLGKHALRSARREGLRVRYVGSRAFIDGSDWLDFVRTKGDDAHRGGITPAA